MRRRALFAFMGTERSFFVRIQFFNRGVQKFRDSDTRGDGGQHRAVFVILKEAFADSQCLRRLFLREMCLFLYSAIFVFISTSKSDGRKEKLPAFAGGVMPAG